VHHFERKLREGNQEEKKEKTKTDKKAYLHQPFLCPDGHFFV
jgi:hypothetical protein